MTDADRAELSRLTAFFDRVLESAAMDQERIAELERRLAELEAGPVTPPGEGLVHTEDFAKAPTDIKDGGLYLLDKNQPDAFLRPIHDPNVLVVRCHAKGALDRNGTRRRSEFGLPDPRFPNARIYRRDDYGKRFAYSCDVGFPVQQFADSGKVVCWQHHGGAAEPGDAPGRNPPLSLEFWGAPRRLRWVLAGFEKTERRILWELPEPEPRLWYAFKVEATWGVGPDALLEIYLDGKKILTRIGQNGYDDTPGFTFARWGVYWPNATERPDDYKAENFREVWFRNLRIEEIP